jgi:hypothetical protein
VRKASLPRGPNRLKKRALARALRAHPETKPTKAGGPGRAKRKASRGRGPNRFKQREIARVLRAVEQAGGTQYVEIDPASGRIIIVPGASMAKPGKVDGDDASKGNPWDEVLSDAANQKRPT